jgi:hypothetical protein
MAELKQRFPADLDYVFSLDTTHAVTEGINEIVKTLGAALALVMLVVFIFLQGWRATLIPLLAVPVSLIGTFAVFPLLFVREHARSLGSCWPWPGRGRCDRGRWAVRITSSRALAQRRLSKRWKKFPDPSLPSQLFDGPLANHLYSGHHGAGFINNSP